MSAQGRGILTASLVALVAALAYAQSPAPIPGEGKADPVTSAKSDPAAPEPKKKEPPIPAKKLFGAVRTPAAMKTASIGGYAKGCLAGAKPLPITNPAWQVMRLSRNRNWGNPVLVAWVEKFAEEAKAKDGWNGLLVGDMSQPRGGPMMTGHASHQIGLDVDLWYLQAPEQPLSREDRETVSANNVVNADKVTVNPELWTETHAKLIKRAAGYSDVERIFVHPAIKKSLCETAAALGSDRSWLSKVRPWWGHDDHFHVRLRCPPDSPGCKPQPEPAADDGCGTELTHWLKMVSTPPKPEPESEPQPKPPSEPPNKPEPKPGHYTTLDQLPTECKAVLAAGETEPTKAVAKNPVKKSATTHRASMSVGAPH